MSLARHRRRARAASDATMPRHPSNPWAIIGWIVLGGVIMFGLMLALGMCGIGALITEIIARILDQPAY